MLAYSVTFSIINPSCSLLLIIPEAACTPPWYLNIHIWYEVEADTRNTSWQKMTNDDVIILVIWLGYNLQTRNKMRSRYPISGSIATILISNLVRYVRVTKELHRWHHRGSHVTWIQCTDWIENEDQILYLKFHMHYWLQLCQICWGDIRFEFMTSSWWSDQIKSEAQILYLQIYMGY